MTLNLKNKLSRIGSFYVRNKLWTSKISHKKHTRFAELCENSLVENYGFKLPIIFTAPDDF